MSSFTMIRSFLESKINERRSRESIKKLQEKKFRKILKFAYNNSTFYHNLYKSQGINNNDLKTIDIKKLPIVDKNIIMENFDDVTTTNDFSKQDMLNFLEKSKDSSELYNKKYHVVHTSGSSGQIGVFVYSIKDWDSFFPLCTRFFNFNFKKTKSSFFGAVQGHYIGVSFNTWLCKGITRFFSKPLILDITKPLEDAIKQLNDFQPTILGGYFTGLKILAEQQAAGNLKVHPKYLVSAGEGIVQKDKKFIEEIFGVPLTNLYGLAECTFMGVGKKEYNGIYLMDDIALVEIEKEYALVTNLFNKTQPLIRYKIDDLFSYKKDEKKILPFTLVDDIIGRTEAMVWLENNEGKMDFIHPIVIAEFYVKGLDKLQIIIKDKTSFDFLAVITDENKDRVITKIKEELDKILLEKKFTNVKYEIKVVDNLTVDPETGKFRLIVIKNN